ncbi:DUF1289 domain-containing protein [Pseudoalteromonas sp. T1lg48]|uniref:DUF1289 domain-containing protein n=1 Tax=Pseudoalteromonas sp. T1lg48 TaxID=2077100 RepID=UPI000CF6AED9|nr:DUF1289 domain-containing protein [Pseudoalteromonas sp. T1lg48]
MQQLEIFSIDSPCKGICQVNSRGYCRGCYRSREERFHWNQLTDAQKRHVNMLCQQRYKRFLARQQEQGQQPPPMEQGELDL